MDGQPEPFLIILDLDMPTMSGWEFLDIVGRYRRLAGVPVVVTSGVDGVLGPHHARVVARLVKPIVPLELVARVKRGDFTIDAQQWA